MFQLLAPEIFANYAHTRATHTKDIRPNAESCSSAIDAMRAIVRAAGQEIEIADLKAKIARRTWMDLLEVTLFTWRAIETFRSCAMEFPWALVFDWHSGGFKGTM